MEWSHYTVPSLIESTAKHGVHGGRGSAPTSVDPVFRVYSVKYGAQGIILLGLTYGFFTPWGFFKQRWLTVKWILFTIQTIVISVYKPWRSRPRVAEKPAGRPTQELRDLAAS